MLVDGDWKTDIEPYTDDNGAFDRAHEHGHDAEPVIDRVHDNSWSANLEQSEHKKDRKLILKQAIDAVEHTTDGNHVNLVTHENHDHPSEHLTHVLEDEFADEEIDWEYIDQCGCGGYVVRVYVYSNRPITRNRSLLIGVQDVAPVA